MATHDIPKIEVQPRDRVGSRYAARLRKEGKLPGVIYGHKEDPKSVTLDYRQFTDLLEGHAHLLQVTIDGKTEPCLIKDMQWDHLGISLVHVDLARVNLSEEVEVEVELALTGEPKALEQAGAILDHPLGSIEIACRADAIPESIQHDISELAVGDAVTVADLKLPDGVRAVTDSETVIAQIQVMAEEPEEETAEAVEGEPEVIGRSEQEEGETDEK
ncbi:50S ribosomal protein L25 [Phycisphaerales bacterium AB-hyl4]|uniref:Large ribosomal subunit protein bL25 n=1 Tax=Natronomicrosphaera hydrolytica TaxID=3242702 RepID=A0ABV4U630_9BACT